MVVYPREGMAVPVFALLLSVLLLGCEQDSDEPELEILSGAAGLVSGPSHTCALLQSGRIACWGLNNLGQLATRPATSSFEVLDPLGIATTEQAFYRSQAMLVDGLQGVERLEAGESHTCALLDDKTVRCWGDAAGGQLGAGDFSQDECEGRPCSRQPVAVIGLQSTVDLSLGALHSCAADGAGELSCWGSQVLGVETAGLSTCDGTFCATEPVAVRVPGPVVQVVSGFVHSCALLDQGEVWCWGVNVLGSIGVSSPWTVTGTGVRVRSEVKLPARVELPLPAVRLLVAPGGFYSCALLQDGSLRCWGDDSYGQLGAGGSSEPCVDIGSTELRCSTTPLASGPEQPVALAVLGERHACAATENGSLYCWGYAANGQLGTEFERLQQCPNGALCSPDPLLVEVESRPLDLALGTRFTCVLQSDGRVLCWGWGDPINPIVNEEAQRLDCVFAGKPCQVNPDWQGSAAGIFVTEYDKLCVLTSAGEVHCLRNFESGESRFIRAEPMLVER